MLISKLRTGLLCLHTPHGVRYVRPSLLHRLQLLWVFRNFRMVPFNVLTQGQCELIESLRNAGPFVAMDRDNYGLELLGTIEYPAQPSELPEKKSPKRVTNVVPFSLPAGVFMEPRRAAAMPSQQSSAR